MRLNILQARQIVNLMVECKAAGLQEGKTFPRPLFILNKSRSASFDPERNNLPSCREYAAEVRSSGHHRPRRLVEQERTMPVRRRDNETCE
jgi:hypothetical protein